MIYHFNNRIYRDSETERKLLKRFYHTVIKLNELGKRRNRAENAVLRAIMFHGLKPEKGTWAGGSKGESRALKLITTKAIEPKRRRYIQLLMRRVNLFINEGGKFSHTDTWKQLRELMKYIR